MLTFLPEHILSKPVEEVLKTLINEKFSAVCLLFYELNWMFYPLVNGETFNFLHFVIGGPEKKLDADWRLRNTVIDNFATELEHNVTC